MGRTASHKLLRPGSKGFVKGARVPEWLGWSYTTAGWRSTLELTARGGDPRGLDTAACVASLSHCPGCHLAYKVVVGLLGCLEVGLGFNELKQNSNSNKFILGFTSPSTIYAKIFTVF